MDAVIICGGQGTRVRSITRDKIPKILIPIEDLVHKRTMPFLEYLIEILYTYGVRRMTLAAGFLGGVIEDYLETRHILSSVNPWMDININIENQPLDTGGSILNCLNRSGSGPHSDPFLVINGDSLVVPEDGVDSFEDLYYSSVEYGRPKIAMITCKTGNDGRYGSLYIYNGFIDAFDNKTGKTWINCGWYIMRRSAFKDYYNPICTRDKIQTYDVVPMSLERDLFAKHLKYDVIHPIIIDDKQFVEIGTPGALSKASIKLMEIFK